jgi:hypothetical protein
MVALSNEKLGDWAIRVEDPEHPSSGARAIEFERRQLRAGEQLDR